jgi:hypothetical protein
VNINENLELNTMAVLAGKRAFVSVTQGEILVKTENLEISSTMLYQVRFSLIGVIMAWR